MASRHRPHATNVCAICKSRSGGPTGPANSQGRHSPRKPRQLDLPAPAHGESPAALPEDYELPRGRNGPARRRTSSPKTAREEGRQPRTEAPRCDAPWRNRALTGSRCLRSRSRPITPLALVAAASPTVIAPLPQPLSSNVLPGLSERRRNCAYVAALRFFSNLSKFAIRLFL
jgi:hypothetical protein